LKTRNINFPEIQTIANLENGPRKIQVYPNPVTESVFTIQFSQVMAGDYYLELTDIMGRQVLQKKINISGEQQAEKININPLWTHGVYLVKLRDQNSKEIFTHKIVVQ